jgi:hypothetical protein
MARPELRSSFGARLERVFDGVPGLASHLVFTSLLTRAPLLARAAAELARYRRGRVWLRGNAETAAGPVRIAHLGSPDRVTRWFLHRLGAGTVERQEAARVPGAVACDVELCLVPLEETLAFARDGWLLLPRYVHHLQDLREGPSSFEVRVARRARAQGLTLGMTRTARELDDFQRRLYDPMLARRHGEHALRTGRALLRLGQLRGGLCVVRSNGRAVAGAVAAPNARDRAELEIWALGVAEDAPAGAGFAAVLGWVSWAREHGLERVDHVASLPLYSDGLTRQKLRWGTTLHEPVATNEVVAMRVVGAGAAVKSWLSGHVFAARSEKGLVPVSVTEPGELSRAARSLASGSG